MFDSIAIKMLYSRGKKMESCKMCLVEFLFIFMYRTTQFYHLLAEKHKTQQVSHLTLLLFLTCGSCYKSILEIMKVDN